MIRGHFASKSIGFLTVVTYSASGPRDGKWALVPEPIFPNLEPLQILTEISHILFMTFANSGPQCLPAHFPQSGAPPNPYWNMPHSSYHICQFWAPVPPGPFSPIWAPSQPLLKYNTFSLWHLPILGLSASRPIFPNLEPLRILTEISHILFMTFANSGPQCLPAHFP